MKPDGYTNIPNRVFFDKRLTREDIQVLIVLKGHDYNGGGCFPSYQRLAEIAKCSRPTIIRSVKNLQKAGYISNIKKTGRSNNFTLAKSISDTSEVNDRYLRSKSLIPQKSISDTSEVSQVDPKNYKEELQRRSTREKKPTPEKPPTLIDHFYNKHKERFGQPYAVSGARDGKLMKTLGKDFDENTICRCMDLFFKDNDPWLQEAGWTIPIFKSRINQYIQKLSKPQSHSDMKRLSENV